MMDNKSAAKYLKEHYNPNYPLSSGIEHDEAINAAIKSLEENIVKEPVNMYVWIVSYFDENDTKSTVASFKHKEAAITCFEEISKKHSNVSIDKCPVYKDFYVVDNTQEIYLR